jgi:hypothetical protein
MSSLVSYEMLGDLIILMVLQMVVEEDGEDKGTDQTLYTSRV